MDLILKMNPWMVLTLSFVLGGISIFLGNGLFPYLKEQQELSEKKRDEALREEAKVNAVKNILADEVFRNIRRTHRVLKSLEKGVVKISPLESTALYSVIASGTAQSLEPAFFKKLLNASYSIKQAQSLHEHLTQLMLSPTAGAAAQRKPIEEELKPYLIVSRTLLIELFHENGLEPFLTHPDDVAGLKQELAADNVQL